MTNWKRRNGLWMAGIALLWLGCGKAEAPGHEAPVQEAVKPAAPAPPADAACAELLKERESDNEYFRGTRSPLAAVLRRDVREGKTLTVGSGPDDTVRYEHPALKPAHLTVLLEGATFHVSCAPGVTVKYKDADVTSADLAPGGTLFIADDLAVRLAHQGSPGLVLLHKGTGLQPKFTSLSWYDCDPAWRVEAVLKPWPEVQEGTLDTSRGSIRKARSPGVLAFTKDGAEYSLEAWEILDPGETQPEIGVFFRDATTGTDTYTVGRYVDPEPVDGKPGTYLLDFNKAYNPSCAFSPHYNCPIPPKNNTLPIAVTAGERVPPEEIRPAH